MSKYDQPSEPPTNPNFERADSIVEGLTNQEVLIALEHRGFTKEIAGVMGTLRSLLRQDIYETLSLEEE